MYEVFCAINSMYIICTARWTQTLFSGNCPLEKESIVVIIIIIDIIIIVVIVVVVVVIIIIIIINNICPRSSTGL